MCNFNTCHLTQSLSPEIWRSMHNLCCQNWSLLYVGWSVLCDSGCSTGSSSHRVPWRRHCRWPAAPRSGPGPDGAAHPLYLDSTPVRLLFERARPCRTWCHYPEPASRWKAARHPPQADNMGRGGWCQMCWGQDGRRSQGFWKFSVKIWTKWMRIKTKLIYLSIYSCG